MTQFPNLFQKSISITRSQSQLLRQSQRLRWDKAVLRQLRHWRPLVFPKRLELSRSLWLMVTTRTARLYRCLMQRHKLLATLRQAFRLTCERQVLSDQALPLHLLVLRLPTHRRVGLHLQLDPRQGFRVCPPLRETIRVAPRILPIRIREVRLRLLQNVFQVH